MPSGFSELLQRVRQGDAEAADQVFREYEASVRRVIRIRLTSSSLRRQVDSVDICQSVMLRFFINAGLGRFEINNPKELLAILAAIANNRIREIARTQQAARRDIRRLIPVDVHELPLVHKSPSPGQRVCDRDLLEAIKNKLPDRYRHLADERMKDRSWADIGQEMGLKPDALRIAFSRAIDRVVCQLGID
ncbi:MAG: RNA polymerase sigma factor [Planctomycetota bacterium]